MGIGSIDNRTRYDGVAYEFVEFRPRAEPASLGMMLVAVPLLAASLPPRRHGVLTSLFFANHHSSSQRSPPVHHES